MDHPANDRAGNGGRLVYIPDRCSDPAHPAAARLAKGFALDIPAGYGSRGSQDSADRIRGGRLNRMGLPTQQEQNSRCAPHNGLSMASRSTPSYCPTMKLWRSCTRHQAGTVAGWPSPIHPQSTIDGTLSVLQCRSSPPLPSIFTWSCTTTTSLRPVSEWSLFSATSRLSKSALVCTYTGERIGGLK